MTDRVDQVQLLAQTSAADQTLGAAGATGTRIATFGASSQLVGLLVALRPAPTTYGYDPQGNRTSIAPQSTTLTYDQANRLAGYGPTATYKYNGDGLRMSKTISGTAQAFTWDESGGLPLLLKDGSTSYVYGQNGLPLEQIIGTTVLYYHQDQLGSTRALTDSTGAVQATYTYDAYGNPNGKTGAADTPFKFAGQYTDAESGYQYLRARYYDPATAQFLSRDPIVDLTRQAYSYVDNNPVNGTDPTGLLRLPTSGEHPYESPDKKSGRPIRLPGTQGYRDADGNRWVKDDSKPNEWDVQHPDGSHTNIGEDGNRTHGPDNFPQSKKRGQKPKSKPKSQPRNSQSDRSDPADKPSCF
jgi:RHS repeat-associated protein